jgi:hypothetical protein
MEGARERFAQEMDEKTGRAARWKSERISTAGREAAPSAVEIFSKFPYTLDALRSRFHPRRASAKGAHRNEPGLQPCRSL